MRAQFQQKPVSRRPARCSALLHQGAPADEFARRLAEAESLADDHPGKSTLVETVRMAMAVRNRLELQQQRERGMLAVIESAQDLSSRLDLVRPAQRDRVARPQSAPLRRRLALDLRAERGEYEVLVADGALSQSTSHMVARRDRGVGSILMSTRLPFTTPDYLHDKRFAHDPKLDDTFRAEGIAALVGVPLIWDGEVIGLLFVADRYHRTHTAQSISILSTLATHGAVALKNANDFRRANAALANAEQARAELERHMRSMQAAAEAHEQMTSLLARGASLATLCESVARAARRQRAGARRSRAGHQPRRRRRLRRPRRRGARSRTRRRRRHRAGAQLEPPGRALGARGRGRRRVVPRHGGDRRRRHPRVDGALSPRRARRPGDPHLRAELEHRRHRPALAGAHGSDPPPRRFDAAALARLAAPGRAGAAGEPGGAARRRSRRSRSR